LQGSGSTVQNQKERLQGGERLKVYRVEVAKIDHRMKCPKCGSDDTSSDATVDKNGDLIDEYDFCFKCGHTWNRRKTEYCI